MDGERLIYLDHMASTPLDPVVRAAMLPWLDAARAGNPHSAHPAGWRAERAVEAAREQVAALIGARPSEIVLTSGATEANNLALLGPGAARLVVSAVEHPSVLGPAAALRARGVAVETLPVDGDGAVDPDAVDRALAPGGALVSVMAANNEIGTVQPVDAIAAACRRRGALFHCDAVQAVATRAVDVAATPVDLVSLSGHKLYGPQGIGALYVRAGTPIEPLLRGGAQERGRRAGTVPVALAVGLGAASAEALRRRDADARHLAALRERLFAALAAACPEIRRTSPAAPGAAVPGCLAVALPGVDAADLLLDLPALALSTGSACSTASDAPSHVLRAVGLSPEAIHGSLRFGIGRFTTEAEIDAAAAMVAGALRTRS